MQIWHLSSFLDTLSLFWSQPLLKPTNLTKQVFFIMTSGEPAVNRIDSQALTLAGPKRNHLLPDPLAELHLDNRLFMCKYLCSYLPHDFTLKVMIQYLEKSSNQILPVYIFNKLVHFLVKFIKL